jgi:hypothetical protein
MTRPRSAWSTARRGHVRGVRALSDAVLHDADCASLGAARLDSRGDQLICRMARLGWSRGMCWARGGQPDVTCATRPYRSAKCAECVHMATSSAWCIGDTRHSSPSLDGVEREATVQGGPESVFLVHKGAFRGPEWDRGTSLLVRVGWGPRFGVEQGAIWGASIILLGLGHLEGRLLCDDGME